MKSDPPLFEQIDKSIDKKVNLSSNSSFRYTVRATLAYLFLTLGAAVVFVIAIKGGGIFHGLGRMFRASIFSRSLVMILRISTELGASNILYMTVGTYHREVNFSLVVKIPFICILFDLIDGALFGFLAPLTAPSQDLPKGSFLFTSTAGELEKTTLQTSVEVMFANIVVNTTVLVSMRMKNDAGKVAAIIFIISIFAFLGSEHVVANSPALSLAHFAPDDAIEAFTAGNAVHDLFWAFIDSSIGGGPIMGLGYAWSDKDNKSLTYFD